MSAQDMDAIAAELRQFLATEVLGRQDAVDDDAVLAELGVDSFALMEVILFIERRWSVVLPMDRLTPEAVRTLRGLTGAVTQAIAA